MKVLVTGADGFIGSHLVDLLVRAGHEVTAFVLYNSFNSVGWLEQLDVQGSGDFRIEAGDVRDAESLQAATHNQETVIHLASLVAIPYSYQSPRSYIETNVLGTMNVMEACRKAGVKRVIHTSTSEVYGTAHYVPIDEDHRLLGQSPYSASKIGADQVAHSYWASFGVPVTTLRPFNTYGPRQSQRAFIPSVIVQLLSGATQLSLGSLTPTRDLTYVTDTARGFQAIAESGNGVGEVFNIGSGYEVSMGEVVKRLGEIIGLSVPIILEEKRLRPAHSEVERLWADNTKMCSTFDWKPDHDGVEGLRLGLEKTVRWFRDNLAHEGYNPARYVV